MPTSSTYSSILFLTLKIRRKKLYQEDVSHVVICASFGYYVYWGDLVSRLLSGANSRKRKGGWPWSYVLHIYWLLQVYTMYSMLAIKDYFLFISSMPPKWQFNLEIIYYALSRNFNYNFRLEIQLKFLCKMQLQIRIFFFLQFNCALLLSCIFFRVHQLSIVIKLYYYYTASLDQKLAEFWWIWLIHIYVVKIYKKIMKIKNFDL